MFRGKVFPSAQKCALRRRRCEAISHDIYRTCRRQLPSDAWQQKTCLLITEKTGNTRVTTSLRRSLAGWASISASKTHFSAITGGACRSLTLFRLGAPLRSHLRPVFVHSSQHTELLCNTDNRRTLSITAFAFYQRPRGSRQISAQVRLPGSVLAKKTTVFTLTYPQISVKLCAAEFSSPQ